MIFHEIYSIYFDAVARILKAATTGVKLNNDLLFRITNHLKLSKEGFELLQAGLDIIPNDKISKPFNFFDSSGSSRIEHCPETPLSLIELRWLKTILCDPRIQLFNVSCEGLENIEPYYYPRDIFVYDREGEGDPWTDSNYITHFRTILEAMQSNQNIYITWLSRESLVCEAVCRPDRYEYSELDDRMRLWASTNNAQLKITLCRVMSCNISNHSYRVHFPPQVTKPLPEAGSREREKEKRENVLDDGDKLPERLILEIIDDRNTLERALFHFSHLQKQDILSLGNNRYRLIMSIDSDDREEIANRVIGFGPYLHVVEPQWLIEQISNRLKIQIELSHDN